MPSLPILKTITRELLTRKRSPRIPEPDLIMDDPDKVADYTKAVTEVGIMASTYLFNCAQICEILRPGDLAVDLGCGPATQLGMIARLNPDTHFIGIDLSEDMLQTAREHIGELGLDNVEFKIGDITSLAFLHNQSIDALFSTMTLHHLPDFEHLQRTFSEISRFLKPEGGLYLIDFAHLKSEKSIHYFAYQHEHRQPELFTIDYLNSLRAAFSLEEFKHLTAKNLPESIRLYSTFLISFMVIIKSNPRLNIERESIAVFAELRKNLNDWQQTDLNDLINFFKFGGVKSHLLP